MNAHIITIGDEILIGQTLNSNAADIGNKLVDIQIFVKKASIVADDETEIINEFKDCWDKNDLIIVTGGLGPTHDDVTRQCVVKFFNTELVEDQEVLDDVKKIFEKRGRKIDKINECQALVPKIATPIRNILGTAPGFYIEKDDKVFVVLPGVPAEMNYMMESFLIPKLKEKVGEIKSYSLRSNLLTTGIPESLLYKRLGNLKELLDGAKLAFLPNQFGVKMRITVKAETEILAKNKLLEIEQKIRGKVGRYIYSRTEETLEEVVGRLLTERELTISLAESCTGGLLSNLLTNVPGASKYFERGIISYGNSSKIEILKVKKQTLEKFGAVSEEVAIQMAEGVRNISKTNIGLSITGIMGPTGATTDKPVGLVYIGFCDDKTSTAKKFVFGEDRIINKHRTTQAALELIRRYILGIE
ncbi:MAG: competence/damage-inducible protein A [Ignavibacteriales bacterium CG12_big_fil_rev_8_21_14_0_65_30_8]|nr:MAG: competence/damage-inducible protein A [Ignavibacteriales bacterium CG12_big_fil_rev_8_21_14_0_65_30_8]